MTCLRFLYRDSLLQAAIENNYQRRLDQKNQYLMASVACSLVLLILLILVSTKKKRE